MNPGLVPAYEGVPPVAGGRAKFLWCMVDETDGIWYTDSDSERATKPADAATAHGVGHD